MINPIQRLLDHCVWRSVHCPYSVVPISTDQFLPNYSKWHICRKFLSKLVRLLLLGQLGRRVSRVPIGARVIWIQVGKTNLGDVLMELSGRQLLKGLGLRIDLYTLPAFKSLFEGDVVFSRVFSTDDRVDVREYQYAILTEFNHPSTYAKGLRFRQLPYACLFGFFRGPDRNQTLFSHAAINDVFDLGKTREEILTCARPFLEKPSDENVRGRLLHPLDPGRISIGVGGIDPRRTYQRWPEVLSCLDLLSNESLHVTLLGSHNGADMAQSILSDAGQWRLRISNEVGVLTLMESRDRILESNLFVGCDGGLMHLAHTTGCRTITLFASENPRFFITPACQSGPVRDGLDVNGIEPILIAEKIISKLKCLN